MASVAFRMWLPLLAGGLLSLSVSVGSAQEPAKQASAPPPLQRAIPHQKGVLKNGLRVILQEDHRSPLITVLVSYRVGALHEAAGKSGLAHLFEHLMFDGSQSTLPLDAHDILYQAGAVQSNGSTHWDRTDYYETVPAVNLESALWMEADRMAYLTGASSGINLGLARDVVKNERRQRIETVPYSKADQAMAEALFPAPHPYSRYVIGSQDDLDSATTKDMSDFYKNWYGPNNATLVLVGDLDSGAAMRLVNRYFAPLPSRGAPSEAHLLAAPLKKEVRLQVAETLGKSPMLMLAWASPALGSEDDAVADIVANVVRARLRKRLVRVMNLAVGVGVSQESRQLHSLFRISLTLRNSGQHSKARAFTDAILEELRLDTATAEEVERARLSFTSTYYWQLEDPLSRAEMLASWDRYQGTPDWFRQNLARYQKITPADVGRFVRNTLQTDSRVVVNILPQEGK